MNEYESNRILDFVKKINYHLTKSLKDTDCYVLNTCHIREKATEKVYHEVGRLKKEFKDKKKPIILIAGCVAQAEGDMLLKKEKYIDAVIGPQSYHEINKIILNVEKKYSRINSTEFETIEKFDQLNLIKNNENKTSSYITIQEGCDKFCKFCVVPYTRGPECSRPFSDILSEIKQLTDNGSKEVILLGQNVNAYNYQNKKLSDLIYSINENKNIERIRYTTSHPKDFSNDSFVSRKSDICIIPPNSFVLASTIEYFKIPKDVLVICVGKSTYARCGIIVNVTPLEPEWEGHVTLEFSNTTPLPAKVYAGEGACQFIFMKADQDCLTSYKDRSGKYMKQTGVTLPKI